MNLETHSSSTASRQERDAALGRYMLEVRHGFNNALTAVLGNAELLLLEPGGPSAQTREQVETIHTMALQLCEVMRRFSSLESEMRFPEEKSQSETNIVPAGISRA